MMDNDYESIASLNVYVLLYQWMILDTNRSVSHRNLVRLRSGVYRRAWITI